MCWCCALCSGALLVVMSLAGWVLWYSGNIEGLTPAEETKQGHISCAVDRLARTLSRKIRSHGNRYWAPKALYFTHISVLMRNTCWIKCLCTQCYKHVQKSQTVAKFTHYELLWAVFLLCTIIIWLLFNKAVVSCWISIKKKTFIVYGNVFFFIYLKIHFKTDFLFQTKNSSNQNKLEF